MTRRFQFSLIASLLVMLFVAVFFGVTAFVFYREFIELQEQLRVEQANGANRERVLREMAMDLIKAEDRIKQLEGR